MAVLHNEALTLRLAVQLADREALSPGRVIASVGVECLDRRDDEFWPLVRLPVVYFAAGDLPLLVGSIRRLCALEIPGVGLRSDGQGDLVLQLARQEGGGVVVEAGFDLAPVLAETAGRPGEPGRELVLFRFQTTTGGLVQFADAIRSELDGLRPPRKQER
ncbi:MAG: hypothetical protein ACYC8T_12800 [Myxococcaceae bacterium]